MSGRCLIINADDLGMRPSVNQAIATLFEQGRITSASMLPTAPYARQAAQQCRAHIGVHWTLHSDFDGARWPAASGSRSPSLLDGELGLYSDAGRMAKAAASADVTRELAAQIAAMQAMGVAPDHADSHGGTLYGMNGRWFFLNAFRLCKRHGLPFRFPKSSRFLARQFGKAPSAAIRAAHRAIVLTAQAMGVKLIDDMISHPMPVEKIASPQALRDFYLREIAQIDEGITEVFLHPALPDEEMLCLTPQWQKRIWEYEFLLSDEAPRLLQREGIELVSWDGAPF